MSSSSSISAATVVSDTGVVVPTTDTEQNNTTVDEAVAEAACSYSIEFATFETAIKGLIDRAESAVEVPPPRAAAEADAAAVSVSPAWATSVKNLGDAMAAASVGAKGFREMFVRFYVDNVSSLTTPLNFSTGETVCDAFFRSTDRISAPGGAGVSKFKGPVVYYSTTNPRFASVCLPIGEYYCSAIKVYMKSQKTNLKKQLLPTLTLLDFYLTMYHALEGNAEAQETLVPNIYDLCDAAEAQAPASGPGKRAAGGGAGGGSAGEDMFSGLLSGGAAGGFGAMLSGILSSMGGGGASGSGANNMAGALGGISNIVKTLVDRVAAEESMITAPRAADGSIDPAAIVGCIGNVFQSPDIQRQIAETTRAARGAFGMNPTPKAEGGGVGDAVELPPS